MRLRQVVQSLSTPPLTLCCSMRMASAHREPIFFRVLTDAGLNPFTLNPTRIETETSFHESHTNDVAVASIHFSISEARWFRLQDVEMPLLLDAIIVFIVWILGRSVAGVFPRLGTSRGDGQRPSATVATCASVRPLSPRHSVPLPSATALGLGIHRWPRSTCQPIIGSWREPIRILQVAHRPICSLASRSQAARSPTEVMLSVPV